jgi:hypothetical protein
MKTAQQIARQVEEAGGDQVISQPVLRALHTDYAPFRGRIDLHPGAHQPTVI